MMLLLKYVKSGFVQILRNPIHNSFLIIGFALGMAVSLFALLIWNIQRDFDSRIKDSHKLFRVTTKVNHGWHFASSPFSLFQNINDQVAVARSFQLVPLGKLSVQKKSTSDFEISASASFITSGFFERLDIEFISRNEIDFQSNPDVAFITSDLSHKIFGNEESIGKSIILKDYGEFVVNGVINSRSYKYHFNEDIFIPSSKIASLVIANRLKSNLQNNDNYSVAYTYVDIGDSKRANIQSAISKLNDNYLKTIQNENLKSFEFILQPVNNILSDDLLQDTSVVLNQPNFLMYLVVALILLLISAANYFNIQIFNLVKRLKEFGIRKVHGAGSNHVLTQIIIENVVVSIISLSLAFVVVQLLPLPHATDILGATRFNLILVISIIVFALIVGVLTGLIPAVLVTKKVAVYSINAGPLKTSKKGFSVANILVTIQLIISIIFVFNFLLVEKQTQMILEKDYGYNVDQVVSAQLTDKAKREFLKIEFSKDSRIEQVSFMSKYFGSYPDQCKVSLFGMDNAYMADFYSIDAPSLEVFNLEILYGENINREDKLSSQSILINETAMKHYQLSPSNVIGQTFILNDSIQTSVVGVIKDFNYNNLKHPIHPLVLKNTSNLFNLINIRLAKGVDMESFLSDINVKLASLGFTNTEFVSYEAKLKSKLAHTDDRVALAMIGGFVIIITCLGLVGVVLGNAEKTKTSVAINKLCGATSFEVLKKLFSKYLIILSVAFCISLPLAYIIGDMVLSEFVYKVQISITHFIQVVFLCLVVVLVTIFGLVLRYFRMTILEGIRRD